CPQRRHADRRHLLADEPCRRRDRLHLVAWAHTRRVAPPGEAPTAGGWLPPGTAHLAEFPAFARARPEPAVLARRLPPVHHRFRTTGTRRAPGLTLDHFAQRNRSLCCLIEACTSSSYDSTVPTRSALFRQGNRPNPFRVGVEING